VGLESVFCIVDRQKDLFEQQTEDRKIMEVNEVKLSLEEGFCIKVKLKVGLTRT
jgi:hypothetical protein